MTLLRQQNLQLKFSKNTNSNSFSICENSKCNRCRKGASSIGRSSARLVRRRVLSANRWAYVFSNGIAYRLFAICSKWKTEMIVENVSSANIYQVCGNIRFKWVFIRCTYIYIVSRAIHHRHNISHNYRSLSSVWSHTPLQKHSAGENAKWKKSSKKDTQVYMNVLCERKQKSKINCYILGVQVQGGIDIEPVWLQIQWNPWM